MLAIIRRNIIRGVAVGASMVPGTMAALAQPTTSSCIQFGGSNVCFLVEAPEDGEKVGTQLVIGVQFPGFVPIFEDRSGIPESAFPVTGVACPRPTDRACVSDVMTITAGPDGFDDILTLYSDGATLPSDLGVRLTALDVNGNPLPDFMPVEPAEGVLDESVVFQLKSPAGRLDDFFIFSDVPEPSSLSILGLSLVGLALGRRRKAL